MNISLSIPIIKPCDAACNMNCSCCYMKKRIFNRNKQSNRMSDETLQSLVNFFCSSQKKSEFIWHGGEPLLMGLDFFRQAVEFQKKWIFFSVIIRAEAVIIEIFFW